MTRRGNNEGSVYRDKSGNWRGSVTLYMVNGKPKKKYFYGRTKKEVLDKVNRTLNEIRNHTYTEPTSMTLSEWLRIWLDTYCRNTLRPSTFVNYEIYLDKHISPTIGNIRLCDLNAVVLQQFYNDKLKNGNLLTKGGLKPKTLQNMHNMLHKALGQAYRMDMIPKNSADFVSIPKQKKEERRYLTVEETLAAPEAASLREAIRKIAAAFCTLADGLTDLSEDDDGEGSENVNPENGE